VKKKKGAKVKATRDNPAEGDPLAEGGQVGVLLEEKTFKGKAEKGGACKILVRGETGLVVGKTDRGIRVWIAEMRIGGKVCL